MSDPNWLFSTTAQATAAIVAIVGGFLAVRVVDLSSRRSGLGSRIDELGARIAFVDSRLVECEEELLELDAEKAIDFCSSELVEAVASGSDVAQVFVGLVESDPSLVGFRQADELMPFVEDAALRVKRALEELAPMYDPPGPYPSSIDEVRKRGVRIPADDVELYRAVISYLYEKAPVYGLMARFPNVDASLLLPPSSGPTRGQRLVAQIEQLRAEGAALTHEQMLAEELLRSVRSPRGLGYGLMVLVFFALAGMVWPLAVIAALPQHPPAGVRWATVAFFVVGLGAVIGYLAWSVRDAESIGRAEPSVNVDES